MKALWSGVCLVAVVVWGWAWGARGELLSRDPFVPDAKAVACLQRTLAIFKSAREGARPTLRVMIYGQSHSLTPWWELWVGEMARRNPNVHFVVTNKAVVGFHSVALSHACFSDVGPWQPDLILLHSLGQTVDHQRLYQNLRSLCTADILVQSDHPLTPEDLEEPTELEDGTPGTVWAYRNYLWLPQLAEANGLCWADIRTPWKAYLNRHQLKPRALLGEDSFHVNEDGSRLQHELLLAYFEPREFSESLDPWNYGRIRTRFVGEELGWVDGALDVTFVGNRVDVIYDANDDGIGATEFQYTVDGVAPSRISEFRGFDRATHTVGVPWPGVLHVESQRLLDEQRWTLRVEGMEPNGSVVYYSVRGSKTGPDGEGRSDAYFVSKSKQVVIASGQVTVGAAFGFTQVMPPEGYEVTFDAVKRHVETFRPRRVSIGSDESAETLFVGAVDGVSHRLQIWPVKGAARGIRALRVYSPKGVAELVDRRYAPKPVTRLTVRRRGATSVVTWPGSWKGGKIQHTSSLARPEWRVLSGQTMTSKAGNFMEHPSENAAGYFRWVP